MIHTMNGMVIVPLTEYEVRLIQEGIRPLVKDPLDDQPEYVSYVMQRGFFLGEQQREPITDPAKVGDIWKEMPPALYIDPLQDPSPLVNVLNKIRPLDEVAQFDEGRPQDLWPEGTRARAIKERNDAHVKAVHGLVRKIEQACDEDDPRRLIIEIRDRLARLEDAI